MWNLSDRNLLNGIQRNIPLVKKLAWGCATASALSLVFCLATSSEKKDPCTKPENIRNETCQIGGTHQNLSAPKAEVQNPVALMLSIVFAAQAAGLGALVYITPPPQQRDKSLDKRYQRD